MYVTTDIRSFHILVLRTIDLYQEIGLKICVCVYIYIYIYACFLKLFQSCGVYCVTHELCVGF